MNKIQLIGLLALVVALSFQGTANAKEVSGEVAAIDAAGNKLSISSIDPISNAEVKTDISVKPETAYSGIASLGDLLGGEKVLVDAEEDPATGALSATSITVEEADQELEEAAEAAAETAVPAL